MDRNAYVFCVLELFHTRLKRRDIFATVSDRWSDPRARLLTGPRGTPRRAPRWARCNCPRTRPSCWPGTPPTWTPPGGHRSRAVYHGDA